MTDFYLVRHGEADWGLTIEKQLKGLQQDFVPLTEKGRKQAAAAAGDKRLQTAELILSSPYTRALETAAVISRVLGLEIRVEFDLHETLPDLNRDAHSVEKTLKLCSDFEEHEGVYPDSGPAPWESLSLACSRVSAVLRKYTSHRSVIVVCHEKVIKSLIGWKPVGNGSIHCYTIKGAADETA